MKILFSILVLQFYFLAPVLSQKQIGDFLIKGNISGQDTGFIVLNYPGSNGKLVRDTALITNGKFSFKGTIDGPVMAGLTGKVQTRSVGDPNYTNFFLEPVQMKIELEANNFKDGKFNGSKIQQEYQELDLLKRAVEAKYKIQLDSLRTEKDKDKNAEIRERLKSYFTEMDQKDYAFFNKHPQSYVTAYMLRFHVSELALKDLENYYDRLGATMQKTSFGIQISDEIKKLRDGSPGSMARDFSSTDINGNKLSLSDFKGKYVLLDFWASWCVPCRKGNPHLKELYAKYQSRGIEFIGIADDDRAEDAWRKAVDKDGIAMWKHIRRGLKFVKGEYDRSADISDNFGIHTLPTKILIDPKGMIIGRFGEEEEPLNMKLKEIFGE